MPKADLTALAARLEEFLGCLHDPAGRMPYARIVGLDERESHSDELLHLLRGWAVPESVLVGEQSATPVRLAATPQEAADAQG
ncbi:hypothetical protein ACFYZE_06985 [Streptomyces sp. NPDC001796]|uniref:hypothetical protein n=1 Tax=Streptomyces sp. NPDC001796 TaxID=3364609 RepID=UPI0036B41806